MAHISLPASSADMAQLKVGETVYLSGIMLTARDAGHKYLVETFIKGTPPASELALYEKLKADLAGGAIYHCGPVMRQEGDRWTAVAAGPTTSIREEPYEAEVMETYGVRVIIGKGGMGPKTLAACQKVGAIYLHAVGGAAVLQADNIVEVQDVLMLKELGAPEAFWVCRVEGFKGVVTMDAAGQSLHARVLEQTKKQRDALLGL